MKATVLAESYNHLSIFIVMSTPAMSTDSSQVGVALSFVLTYFLSFYLSRFSFYININIEKDIYDCQNISFKLLSVYLCLSSKDLIVYS
jgi:hypothetical protein